MELMTGFSGFSIQSAMLGTDVVPDKKVPVSPDRNVKALRAAVSAARDVMDLCYDAITEAQRIGTGIKKQDVDAYTAAAARWSDLLGKLNEAESRDARASVESAFVDEILVQKDRTVLELIAQYGDHGPQYKMLIELAATIQVRLKLLERMSSAEPSSEFESLSKLFIQTIGQLQKYTEATKSESYNKDLNQVMLVVMGVVERHLEHQPTVLEKIVRDVTKLVMDGGDPGALPAPVIDVEVIEE